MNIGIGVDFISISINIFKYYGRFYSSTESADSYPWWFCLTDESVLSENDMYTRFGYQNSDEALLTGMFVPFFKTDITALEREFLQKLNLQRVLKQLENTSDFDISFREFVDRNSLFKDWHQFEGDRLRTDAINWCRQYGIKFIEDERDYKPVVSGFD